MKWTEFKSEKAYWLWLAQIDRGKWTTHCYVLVRSSERQTICAVLASSCCSLLRSVGSPYPHPVTYKVRSVEHPANSTGANREDQCIQLHPTYSCHTRQRCGSRCSGRSNPRFLWCRFTWTDSVSVADVKWFRHCANIISGKREFYLCEKTQRLVPSRSGILTWHWRE